MTHAAPAPSFVDLTHPAWYRTVSVWNRGTGADPTDPEFDAGLARRRFDKWLTEASFGGDVERLRQRLADAGLTEEQFRGLLAEPPDRLRDRMRTDGGVPEWLRALADAYANFSGDFMLVRSLVHNDTGRLLELAAPLLEQAAAGLDTVLQEVDVARPGGLDTATVRHGLLRQLCGVLMYRLTRVAVLELNIAGLEEKLTATDPAGRFDEFVQAFRQADESLALLARYPLLAFDLVTGTDLWLSATAEMLRRLTADRDLLSATFFDGRDPGAVVDLIGGIGDRHRGGRSVCIVRFADGSHVVYKPRPLDVDVHYGELVDWLNRRGLEPDLRAAAVADRGTYGWMEFVEMRPCADRAAVVRFYRRLGSYLALMHCLHAVDFHYENLIASGEHPVLVDVEAMFHPSRQALEAPAAAPPGALAMQSSVLATGLLPQRHLAPGVDEHTSEFSGITGGAGQVSSTPVACVDNEGTDRMRIVRRRVEMADGNNLASVGGDRVDALDHVADIVDGFTTTWRLLRRHRSELTSADGPLARFGQDTVRCIVRPTQAYANMLVEMTHPYLLSDAVARDRYLDNLWVGADDNATLNRVNPCERHDLHRGDVPVFSTRPGSRHLWCSDGHRIPDRLAEPVLDVVHRRIAGLDDAELRRQVWLIEASFAALTLGEGRSRWPESHAVPRPEPAAADELLDAAERIGTHLQSLMLPDGDRASWVGLHLRHERIWEVRPLDADLYAGLSGLALFFAYLDAVLPDRGFADTAEAALRGVTSGCDEVFGLAEGASGPAVGAFDQIGGAVYLLTHLGVLWDRPDLTRSAEDMALRLATGLESATAFDVISGVSGFLTVLLGLHEVAPRQALYQEIERCAELLLESSVETPHGRAWFDPAMGPAPLAGYSHGASGVASALLGAYRVTGRHRYRRAGLDAVAYERSLFDPGRQNWPDLRDLAAGVVVDDDGPVFMTAWCHGAPGIALTRVHAVLATHDPAAESELRAAIGTIVREGFGLNHSLCHGSLGNCDVLLTAARALADADLLAQVYRIAGGILDSSRRTGWLCGVPGGVETPGLMTGLAGIGYGLLRLAAPDRVPSVLSLSPPVPVSGR